MRSLAAVSLIALSLGCTGCKRDAVEHAAAPAVVWLEPGTKFEGLTIALGHRAGKLQAGGSIEPVVAITRDGEPVAEAMVFSQIAPSGEEAAAVFVPATADSPACYTSKLKLPAETPLTLRFRIRLPNVEPEWKSEITLKPTLAEKPANDSAGGGY